METTELRALYLFVEPYEISSSSPTRRPFESNRTLTLSFATYDTPYLKLA